LRNSPRPDGGDGVPSLSNFRQILKHPSRRQKKCKILSTFFVKKT